MPSKNSNIKQTIIRIWQLSIMAMAIIAGIICLVLMLALVRESVGRYIFNAPTVWVNPLVEFGLVVLTFLGGAYTMQENKHVRVDLLSSHLPERKKYALEIFSAVIGLIFIGSLMVSSWNYALESLLRGTVSVQSVRWPLFPIQIFIPIGCFFSILGLISIIIINATRLRHKEKPKDQGE
ncbi:MAG: TRAP transporter small permease [Dehalococcoidales bacterium]|nr:TRAP transporter small permease [Dehalococcoidales bacterium]